MQSFLRSVAVLLGFIVSLANSSQSLSPKPFNCGVRGLLWTTSNSPNLILAYDLKTLAVVFNQSFAGSSSFSNSAYDMTSGRLVFYDGWFAMIYFDTKTRSFAPGKVSLGLSGPSDLFFDNQGTLWGVYLNWRVRQYSLVTVDVSTGKTTPKFTFPVTSVPDHDGTYLYDYLANKYYYPDGGTWTSIDLATGKAKTFSGVALIAAGIDAKNRKIIGQSQGSLVSYSIDKNVTTTLYPRVPGIFPATAFAVDPAGTGGRYLFQARSRDPYSWWVFDVATKTNKTVGTAPIQLNVVSLCPSK
jgi:hypothetical protein